MFVVRDLPQVSEFARPPSPPADVDYDSIAVVQSGGWSVQVVGAGRSTHPLKRTRSPGRISLPPALAALAHSVNRKKETLWSATSRVPKSISDPALLVICCNPLACNTSTKMSHDLLRLGTSPLPTRRRVWRGVVSDARRGESARGVAVAAVLARFGAG